MRWSFASLASAALLLALPPTAAAQVHLVRLTSPVHRGAQATLTAAVAPGHVTCRITVYYKSGPSHAKGLRRAKQPKDGRVSWTWTVGANTTPGKWRIRVACGTAGTLWTPFRVV
jgi:hypothetical protein